MDIFVSDWWVTHRHSTLCMTPLDEGSARRRDLYLTTHNIHERQTSMLAAGFEPAIRASERPLAHALDSSATGIGYIWLYRCNLTVVMSSRCMTDTL